MKALALAVFLLSASTISYAVGCDGVGNCYVYGASTCTSSCGATWATAYKGFGTASGDVNPAAMTRGVTYWVANGGYGAQNFSTPASGASVITVEGATVANHGPDGTWSNTYAGQATFIGDNAISTSYWTFNGQSRGTDWISNYTLKFWNQADGSGAAIQISGVTNITLQYVEIEGTGAGFPTNNSTADFCVVNTCGTWFDNGIYEGSPDTNLYVGYSYVHHTGNTQFQMNAAPGGVVNNTTTWEYNWVSYNHTGQNGGHDEAYSLYASNVTIRYNIFQDIAGSGQITTAGAGAPQLQNWAVYGNLFFWDTTYNNYAKSLLTPTQNACVAQSVPAGQCAVQYYLGINDNAILDFLGEEMSGFVVFANNTIAGMYNPLMDVSGAAASTQSISGAGGISGCGTGGCPTVTIENNLWVGDGYITGSYCSVVTGATCHFDHNASWQDGVPSGSSWATDGNTGDYNVSGSTNPFVNMSAWTIAGLQLSTPDPFTGHYNGVTLSSPYNLDGIDNVNRGSNGIWDGGALQISGSTPPSTIPFFWGSVR